MNCNSLDPKTKETLETIASRHNATVHQIMLAWLLSKDRVVAIPKASSVRHLEENLRACDIELSESEVLLIDTLK